MKNKDKEFNSFDRTVEMMADMGADSILLSHFDGHTVTGEPYDSKKGCSWALAMISFIDEAVKCKYPKVCGNEEKELIDYLNKNCKTINPPN